MKVLFLVFHGFTAYSGISKKIKAQLQGLSENGCKVDLLYYGLAENGNRQWFLNHKKIVDFGGSLLGRLKAKTDYSAVASHINTQNYDLIYVRSNHLAEPFKIKFLQSLRQKNTRIALEIPTYPYDQEYVGLRMKSELFVDRLFRRQLVKEVDAIVTFSQDEEIFGQRTIRISNGIDFSTIPLRQKQVFNSRELHLIAVAEIHFWHGYDRLIAGLGNYYKGTNEIKVYFHLVGRYEGERERMDIQQAIAKNNLESYVIEYGPLYGEELDAVFNKADFAIGSLGRHRTGITRMRSLKNREYAARGLAFAFSESDLDFDDKSYSFKVPANDSPIDIKKLISFYQHLQMNGFEIRQSIIDLSWTTQMHKVLQEIQNI